MTINTKEKGITLIALIVTIIVLLILAGVTIISLTGENGILGKSSDAKLKREIAKEIEQIKLSVNAVYTSYYDKGYLPVAPLRKELQSSYEGITDVEETSDIGEATKVSKAKKKVDFGSMFGIESLAAENEDVEPTQEFVKIRYTSKREYYVKIKNITGGNSDPVGTIYSKGGTADDDNVSSNAITYNLNGGTNPEDAPTSYKTGEVIGFPTPTKDGSAFEGWYQKSDFSDERVLRTNDTMSGSITLYAKWAEETNPSYFTWTDGSTTSTVTGFSEEGLAVYNAGNLTKLVIPKKHNNLDVTRINHDAFVQKDKLKQVILTENIVASEASSFYGCTGIEELTIPISISAFENGFYPSFNGCTNIKKINFIKGTGEGFSYTLDSYYRTPWYYSRNNVSEITMEEGITKIGDYTFYNCTSLKTLELPTTLTSLGKSAFAACSNWETKIDMSKWTEIGDGAFLNCNNITGTFRFSKNLNEIKASIFQNCEKLTGTVDLSNIKRLGGFAFAGCKGITGEIVIPSSITSTETDTFNGCIGINKVVIPDTVTNLNSYLFNGCVGIEELTIPISINVIEDGWYPAFNGCTNIKKVNFTKGTGEGFSYTLDSYYRTPWYYSRNNVSEITMEEGITKIGDYTFYNCTSLKTLELPTTLTSLGKSAFAACSNWETKIDMSKWTEIGDGAFLNCNNITGTFRFSKNLNEIKASIFQNCEKLTGTVDLSNIKRLGGFAFAGCKGITGEIVIPSSITSTETDTFNGCIGINKVVIPDTVTNLNSYLFNGCVGIEELTIPISINVIEDGWYPAFNGCTNIKKVNFTKGTGEGFSYTLDSYYRTPWYYSRNSVSEITIEEGITKIGNYMFRECSGIKKLNLPSTLATIGEGAFERCSSDSLQVFYKGSSSQWENIDFGGNRAYLSNVLYDQN